MRNNVEVIFQVEGLLGRMDRNGDKWISRKEFGLGFNEENMAAR